jgi:hypothetical protein
VGKILGLLWSWFEGWWVISALSLILRHWEQGKRYPEGPARSYLKVIDREPQAVRRALKAA